MAAGNEPRMEPTINKETTKMGTFEVLSSLELEDGDYLDPSNFINVTSDELDEWLQESLANAANDEKNMDTVAAVTGRRLSISISAEIHRRNSLYGGFECGGTASRRCSNFSEFNFDAKTLPHGEQESAIDSHLMDDSTLLPRDKLQKPEKLPQFDYSTAKRRRDDVLPLSLNTGVKRRRVQDSFVPDAFSIEKQLSRGGLFAAFSKSSQSSSAFCSNSLISITSSSTSSSTVSSRSNSVGASFSSSSVVNQAIHEKPAEKLTRASLNPAVPIAFSVSPGLASCMTSSEKSELEIQNWDRKMGLKKSHSKTMRATGRSRKKLQLLHSKMWRGEKKQSRAKMA